MTNIHKLLLAAAVGVGLTAQSFAAPLLAPGDPIIGGQLDAGQFNVGVAGVDAGINNWPAAEPPEDLINGIIGGGGEKYLNFAETNTGVIVTPTALVGGNPSVVTGIEFWVANDAEPRDPSGYELYGTNAPIAGGGPFPLASFTLISSGALALPATRDGIADMTGFSQAVNFANATAYTSYMLIFPDVKDNTNANSMQLSEVQFDGQIGPVQQEPPAPVPSLTLVGLSLLGLLLGGLGLRRLLR